MSDQFKNYVGSDEPPIRFQDTLEYKTDRRNSIAENLLNGILSRQKSGSVEDNVKLAVKYAEALIAHLDANPPKTGDA